MAFWEWGGRFASAIRLRGSGGSIVNFDGTLSGWPSYPKSVQDKVAKPVGKPLAQSARKRYKRYRTLFPTKEEGKKRH